MHFLIDAQLPPGLADLFRDAGHDAIHVVDVGLLTADDPDIRAWAATRGMVVVTKDADFAAMRGSSDDGPPVIWIRIGNTTNRALRARLAPILPHILAALAEGERLVEVR